jgi:nardilysin
MAAAVSRDDELVIKSPNDQRSYRLLRLANGLCALLVHDPEIYADGYPPQASKPREDEEMEEVDEEDEDGDDDSEEYSDEEGEDDDGEEDEEEDEGESKRRKVKGGAEPIVKKVAMGFLLLY